MFLELRLTDDGLLDPLLHRLKRLRMAVLDRRGCRLAVQLDRLDQERAVGRPIDVELRQRRVEIAARR